MVSFESYILLKCGLGLRIIGPVRLAFSRQLLLPLTFDDLELPLPLSLFNLYMLLYYSTFSHFIQPTYPALVSIPLLSISMLRL